MSVRFAQHYRFTVDDLERMVQTGILAEDDRVELIDGEIIEMTPAGSRHAACVRRLNAWLTPRLAGALVVSVQDPLRLHETEKTLLPVPDFAILRPRADFYADSHPTAADALLVIEVADSSVLYDRNVKAQHYAGAGIPEYWLADLTRDEVTVHTRPEGGAYRHLQTAGRGAVVPTSALPQLGIRVDDIFG